MRGVSKYSIDLYSEIDLLSNIYSYTPQSWLIANLDITLISIPFITYS